MLLAVLSDTHGNLAPACAALRAWQPDMVIHLGDCVRDALELRERFPAPDIRLVRGNCDVGVRESEKLSLNVEGVEIFATHGHLYNVKWGMDALRNAAYFSGARLCLFGHTHQRHYANVGGIEFLNPGSAGSGSEYSAALIRVENGAAECRIHTLGKDGLL